MKKIVILLFSILVLSTAFGQSKEEDIIRLMEMTGSADMGMQIMQNMIVQFRQALPEVPPEYWDQFLEKVSAEDMINIVVPIYDRHLTHDEIKDIIAFYESPTGKTLIQKLPLITGESMTAGQEWGQQLGMEIQNQLVEDGLLSL